MNYTINEIPDEAVKLSGNEMIPIWQGETKKVSVATLASSGIPVGAVMPFANGTTSEDWLLCDGRDTTGTTEELQTHYPALYTYLGNSNVLPTQFDHNRLGGVEVLNSWSNSSTSGASSDHEFTAEYDGFIICHYTRSGNESYSTPLIVINGYSYTLDGLEETTTLPFNKGDVINYKIRGWAGTWTERYEVQYYKQPLYIKAT